MTTEKQKAEERRLAKLDLEMAADRLAKARRELHQAEMSWRKAQLKYFNSLPETSDVKRP